MLAHLENLQPDITSQVSLMSKFLAKLGPSVFFQSFLSALLASCEAFQKPGGAGEARHITGCWRCSLEL